jgi:hypothetical protein
MIESAIQKDIQVNELEPWHPTTQLHKGDDPCCCPERCSGFGFLYLRKRLAEWNQLSNEAIPHTM